MGDRKAGRGDRKGWKAGMNYASFRKLTGLRASFPGLTECLSAVLTAYINLGWEGPGESDQFQVLPEASEVVFSQILKSFPSRRSI